jgi:Tfp pilus assembly protein PilX
MNRYPESKSAVPHQNGTVLVVALILLLFVAIGGLSVSRGVSSDTKMHENYEKKRLAFEAAEEALRRVEKQVIEDGSFTDAQFLDSCNGPGCFTPQCSQGLCRTTVYASLGIANCQLQPGAAPWEDAAIRKSAPTLTVTLDRKHLGAATDSLPLPVKYLVEFRCHVPKVASPEPKTQADWAPYFRVTVWLDSQTVLQTPVMLQSTYQRG